MTLSLVTRAKFGSYSQDNPCPICQDPLNPLLEDKLGSVVIHNNANGARHPMHAPCLQKALPLNQQSGIGTGDCPVCRDPVLWPKPSSLIDKIAKVSMLILTNGAAYGTLSYLTGQPILVAVTPSVLTSLMSIDSLVLQHKLGLQPSLGEIGTQLINAAGVIGSPLLASMMASQYTESIIPNALITATFGVLGAMPFGLGRRFLDEF